jgi:transposase
MESRGYVPHVIPRGQERDARKNPGYKARRWVVEAAHSWFNRFRKILVRFEKTAASFSALLHLAAAIICFRKVGVIFFMDKP